MHDIRSCELRGEELGMETVAAATAWRLGRVLKANAGATEWMDRNTHSQSLRTERKGRFLLCNFDIFSDFQQRCIALWNTGTL